MKALFYSQNLLGDSLQTSPAIRGFWKQYGKQDLQITIGTSNDYVKVVYERMGVPVVIVAPPDHINEDDYDFVFRFDVSRAWTLGVQNNIPCSLAYAVLLGIKIDDILPVFELQDSDPMPMFTKPFVIIQPYSVSCSSWTSDFANKRWQDEKWVELIKKIKSEFGYQVFVLGGPEDKKNYRFQDCSDVVYLFGCPLVEVAKLQREAALVITLDSGVAHLAASQKAKMLELYPACLPDKWMSNLSNEFARIVHYRPWELSVDYVWGLVAEDLHKVKKDESCIISKETL